MQTFRWIPQMIVQLHERKKNNPMCIKYRGTTSCWSGLAQPTAGVWETIQERCSMCVFLFCRCFQLAIVKDRDTSFNCPLFSYRVTLPVVFARQPSKCGWSWLKLAYLLNTNCGVLLWVLCWILKNILAYLRLGTLFSFPQMQVFK